MLRVLGISIIDIFSISGIFFWFLRGVANKQKGLKRNLAST
jgi:hypothetical protein